jgi:hypothetical protein
LAYYLKLRNYLLHELLNWRKGCSLKNYKKEKILLLTLASLFLYGLVFSQSTHTADPLATVKNSIQAKLDGGASVAVAVCQIVKDVAETKGLNTVQMQQLQLLRWNLTLRT